MNYNIQTPSVAMSKQASIYVVMRSFLKKSELLKNKLVPLHPRMRSLRPIVIYSSHKATENQSDMMRMKLKDDRLGHCTTMCGDPSFFG